MNNHVWSVVLEFPLKLSLELQTVTHNWGQPPQLLRMKQIVSLISYKVSVMEVIESLFIKYLKNVIYVSI